jgi:hypothetical protein
MNSNTSLKNGKMKSAKAGNNTSQAEALNVSPHGFWLFVAGREYFLGFDDFPWFRKASVDQLFNVEFSLGHHLYWPELDVDLDLDRVEHPENFPLVARIKL